MFSRLAKINHCDGSQHQGSICRVASASDKWDLCGSCDVKVTSLITIKLCVEWHPIHLVRHYFRFDELQMIGVLLWKHQISVWQLLSWPLFVLLPGLHEAKIFALLINPLPVKAGIRSQKVVRGHKKVHKVFPESKVARSALEIDNSAPVPERTFGLEWNSIKGTFYFRLNTNAKTTKPKRDTAIVFVNVRPTGVELATYSVYAAAKISPEARMGRAIWEITTGTAMQPASW